jgi:hypothetical protein
MGQNQYETLAEAYVSRESELDIIYGLMPHQGRCYLGTVVYQTSSAYTNAVKSRIVAHVNNAISHSPASIAPGNENYLTIDENQVITPIPYELPIATASVLGGIKLGTGLNIDEAGVVTVVTTFLGLDDVVDEDYIGKAKFVPMVTEAEEALELTETIELETVLATLTALADCPSSIAGKGGYTLKVKLDETGFELVS